MILYEEKGYQNKQTIAGGVIAKKENAEIENNLKKMNERIVNQIIKK